MLAIYSKIALAVLFVSAMGCSSAKKFFAVEPKQNEFKPIDNPFQSFNPQQNRNENITWRSRTGDQSVELEIPNSSATELSVPLTARANEREKTGDGIDYRYQTLKPSASDREIAMESRNGRSVKEELSRAEIERSLGLKSVEGGEAALDESYLAKMDVVKQLFGAGRLEAALLELDQLIRIYPDNSRLFEMRGTVLDRMGYGDLAIRSWKQALEFDPKKASLRKMIEKREQQRSVASERKFQK